MYLIFIKRYKKLSKIFVEDKYKIYEDLFVVHSNISLRLKYLLNHELQ